MIPSTLRMHVLILCLDVLKHLRLLIYYDCNCNAPYLKQQAELYSDSYNTATKVHNLLNVQSGIFDIVLKSLNFQFTGL